VVFQVCQLDNIDERVLRYLDTCASPFDEWAEKWPHDGDVQSFYTKETVRGGD
jgi:hypothetical protein